MMFLVQQLKVASAHPLLDITCFESEQVPYVDSKPQSPVREEQSGGVT